MKTLITGGAGFIGARLGWALLAEGHEVVALDDLSTGFAEHVPAGATFIKGDITDASALRAAMDGVEVVLHHAARRAVAQSVDDPVETDRVNTHGTLQVLMAAREAGARRVVVASSSSVYGDRDGEAAREADPSNPKSPYAVSKLAAETYARVFHQVYGLDTVVLRYFNVYGPGQRPDAPYAAVIPLFVHALMEGRSPIIEGDGAQSRDFTYVDDVVEANLRVLRASAAAVAGRTFNIACGQSTQVLEVLRTLCEILDQPFAPTFAPPRTGDIRRSLADVSAAAQALDFSATTSVPEGLAHAVEWFRSRQL